MADEGISVKLTASVEGLLAGMAEARAAVAEGSLAMKESLEGFSTAVEGAMAPLKGLMGILAGGLAFKEVISSTRAWNDQAITLARTLGITTEEASSLAIALGDVYVGTETYTHAAQMMTRQLNAGGEVFAKLGVATKNADGSLRSTTDVMTDVLEKLNGLKAGTDRNVMGLAIFGRSWGEAQKLLRLNAEILEEARAKAERLNLVVGGDAVAATEAYKAGMNEVEDALKGVEIGIGRQLLPILTDLANWFAGNGTAVIAVFSRAVAGLVTVFDLLRFAINAVLEMVVEIAAKLEVFFTTVADASKKLLRFDFTGAKQDWANGNRDLAAISKATADNIARDWEATQARMWSRFAGPDATKGTRVGSVGTEGADPKTKDQADKAGEEQLRAWRQELEEKKAADASWYADATARELAFWRSKLAQAKAGTKEYLAVLAEVNRLTKTQQQEERALAEDAAKFRAAKALEALKDEEEVIKQRAQDRDIDAAEEMRLLEDLENRKYAIRLAAINAERAVANLTKLERQKLDEEAELAEVQHQNALAAIRRQATVAMQKEDTSLFAPLVSAWNGALASMLNGSKGFTSAVGMLWKGLGQTLDGVIMKSLNSYLEANAKQLGAFLARKAQELLFHTQTETAKAATTAASASAQVGSNAAVAGSAAAATAAETPGIGWMIAIPAALAVIAGVMAMKGSIASAAGGWDMVPNDQLAMVHKREMILPAPLADAVRGMAARGGAGGDGAVVVNVAAMDAKSFHEYLMTNKAAVGAAVKQLARNGALDGVRR